MPGADAAAAASDCRSASARRLRPESMTSGCEAGLLVVSATAAPSATGLDKVEADSESG